MTGYQRVLNEAWAKRLSEYLLDAHEVNEAFPPTSWLLATEKALLFDEAASVLAIDHNVSGPFYVVDGQRRSCSPTARRSARGPRRAGRNGFLSRTPYPQTMELLLGLGSEFKCLNTHSRNNGDYCPGSGVEPFETAAVR